MLKPSSHFASSHHVQSPHDLLTGHAVSNFHVPTTSPPVPPVELDVQKIDDTAGSTVVMLKLTDEMFAALEEGQRSGKKLRIHVDEKEGRIEIGDGTASSKSNNTFHFMKQSLPDQTDTLYHTGGVVRNVGTYKTRYQVQATDRSFEETKKRAEMRAELEKTRGTKEMVKKPIPGSSRFNSSSSSTPRSAGNSRVSPAFMSSKASTSQLPNAKGTPNGVDGRKIDMKSELMKKSIKKRIIHLVVTQKYKNCEEVYKKLQLDGLNEDKDGMEKIRNCIDEVSETKPGMSVLSLRSNLLSEVDARWPFFNQDEKAHVRRLQTGPSGPRSVQADAANNFAPMRKKGMERMTASSKTSEKKEKVEEKTPTPPKLEKVVVDDEDYYTAPEPKRRAHNLAPLPTATVPPTASSQTDGPSAPKRPKRVESNSPPEDPLQQSFESSKLNPNKLASMISMQPIPKYEPARESNVHHVSSVAANGGGSTASSRVSSPASSLSSPSQPSCNWEKQFGDIKSLNEAEHYFKMFHKEYPMYMDCHRKLTEVSAEFRSLEMRLKRASEQKKLSPSAANIQEVKKIEKEIQNRFSFFEKDPDFMRARQRHTDLRSKLNVLKIRIGNWEAHRRQTV